MVVFKDLRNSTNNTAFWRFLVKRDLTERPLGKNEDPKQEIMALIIVYKTRNGSIQSLSLR